MSSTSPTLSSPRNSLLLALLAMAALSWLSGVFDSMFAWVKTAAQEESHRRPNIVLIVADDLGYNDTSAINPGGLATPGIARLASEGVTFTRHYADATCTPSRVAILSGRYPERSGFRPVGAEIPEEFPTIAEILRDSGYKTYLTGKWHAGEDRRSAWPDYKGFDGWFGFLNQFELSEPLDASTNQVRRPRYNNPLLRDNGGEPEVHSGHLTDILTDHTIRKIREFQASDTPWFIYHAFLAPHAPIQPAERYRQRFENSPEGAYAALVAQLDDAVARIVDSVDTDNTLVVFVSDNGGTNAQRNNNFPFYGSKNEVYEGAYRTPLFMRWPGRVPTNIQRDDIVMNVDIYPTILAAAQAVPVEGIDGENLWPLIRGHGVPAQRQRSWEVFSANVNSLSFSFLTRDGEWRLASNNGLTPALFNLNRTPAGNADIADEVPATAASLTSLFWQSHAEKSRLAVRAVPGASPGQTLYSGFDAMRTPFRYGFAFGLEIGPLPTEVQHAASGEEYILAGQHGAWELRYVAGHGLQWHIGEALLRDASFEPARCNAVVLTGYLQPRGHLATRAPRSPLKLYSDGFLRDILADLGTRPLPPDAGLDNPTFVNFGGRAVFSNMLQSSFADPYTPQVSEQYAPFYRTAYREKSLMLADVSQFGDELCAR